MGLRYKQITIEERCEMARLCAAGQTIRQIAASLDRAPSTLRLDVTSWGKTDEFARRVEGKDYFFFGSDPQYTARREEGFAYLETTYKATR